MKVGNCIALFARKWKNLLTPAVVEFHYLSPYFKLNLDEAEGVFPLDLPCVSVCLC